MIILNIMKTHKENLYTPIGEFQTHILLLYAF